MLHWVVSEQDIIAAASRPVTPDDITGDLRRLGVRPGGVLLAHVAMSRVGWVVGGPVGMVRGLLEAVGRDGTLVMPTFSVENSDPRHWQRPPVPEAWWPTIRQHMPPYDPLTSPCPRVGRVAEVLRTWPGARRSGHPQQSVTAVGPLAEQVASHHRLNGAFAADSPLGRLADLDADVVRVGTDNNSTLHVAECVSGWTDRVAKVPQGAAMLVRGVRRWVSFDAAAEDDGDFRAIEAAFAETGGMAAGPVGSAPSTLFRQKHLLDFAVAWMQTRR